jgi:diguanylate cyclase (GGDEF)-like protein/PAS domain S-box-containing protein
VDVAMNSTRRNRSKLELLAELEQLAARLSESEEVLRAIRRGEVDAFFVDDAGGERVLALEGAQSPYRVLVEAMNEGAMILKDQGLLLYCNSRLASMLKAPLEAVMGSTLLGFVTPGDQHTVKLLLEKGKTESCAGDVNFSRKDGTTEPVHLSLNPMRIHGEPGVGVVAVDLTERMRAEEELRNLSLVDELTHLLNRRGFTTLAHQQLKLTRRQTGQALLIFFIDLDGLKPINDVLGHLEGDRALTDTAAILRETFRDSDIIARLGGDEFAVLAIGTPEMEPAMITRRLQSHIDAHNTSGHRPYQLSMSVGIVRHDPDNPLPVADMLTRADAAMYEQKRSKREVDARGQRRHLAPQPCRPGSSPRQSEAARARTREDHRDGVRRVHVMNADQTPGRQRAVDAVVDALYDRHPELRERFGPHSVTICPQDIQYHFDHLEAALVAGDAAVFGNYSIWLKDVFESRGVPAGHLAESFDLLGRFLCEQLPAAEAGNVNTILAGAREPGRRDDMPPDVGNRLRALPTIPRYLEAALSGNQLEAQELMSDAMRAGCSVTDAAVRLIQPAMYEIGQLWRTNRVSVAQEHLATAISQNVLARAYLHTTFAAPAGRKAIFAAAAGNLHSLGLRTLSDAFETIGWEVIYLGADVPMADLVRQADASRPDLLCLSLSLPQHLAVARESLSCLRAELGSRCPTLWVGGQATLGGDRAWKSVDADGWCADAAQALEQVSK